MPANTVVIVAEQPVSAKILILSWHQVLFPIIFQQHKFFPPPSLLAARLSSFAMNFDDRRIVKRKWTRFGPFTSKQARELRYMPTRTISVSRWHKWSGKLLHKIQTFAPFDLSSLSNVRKMTNVYLLFPWCSLASELQQWMHGSDGWGSRRKDLQKAACRQFGLRNELLPWFCSSIVSLVTANRMSSKDDIPCPRKQPTLLAPRHKGRLAEAWRYGAFRRISPPGPLLPKQESNLESGDECQIHCGDEGQSERPRPKPSPAP